MNVKSALEILMNEEAIIVGDKTFEPQAIEEVRLETGESVFWIRDGGALWLSVDPSAEEVILFHDLDDDLDVDQDAVVHNGKDYELSLESAGSVMEEGEEIDEVNWRDFEGPGGDILRVIEYAMNSDLLFALGRTIADDELQEV